jgi:hypothetical protein
MTTHDERMEQWAPHSGTPGPWTVEEQDDSAGLDVEGNGYKWAILANGGLHFQNPAYANSEANARLIAAAPDLLAALQQLMEWEGGDWANGDAGYYPEDDTQQRANEVWQDAFDAIAKRYGRTHSTP